MSPPFHVEWPGVVELEAAAASFEALAVEIRLNDPRTTSVSRGRDMVLCAGSDRAVASALERALTRRG